MPLFPGMIMNILNKVWLLFTKRSQQQTNSWSFFLVEGFDEKAPGILFTC